MAEKRGQYAYLDDGTVAQLVQIAANDTQGLAIQPISIQDRLTATFQTQAGVTILPSAWNNGNWIDSFVDGSYLGNLAVSANMTSGTGIIIAVDFSHDQVNRISGITVVNGAVADYATDKDVQLPARYFRINIMNKDAAAPKVTSAYAFLKA